MNVCLSRPLVTALVAAPFLLGCHREVDDQLFAKRICDAERTAWSPTITAEDLVNTLSEDCAEGLGRAVGLDWESFGFTPTTLGDSPTGAYILAGLLTILTHDDGTVAEVLADVDLPEIAREELGLLGLAPEDSDAALWFTMVEESIVTTVYIDPGPGEDVPYTAFVPETGEASFGSLMLGGNPEIANARPPAWGAALILLEASHKFTPAPIECRVSDDVICDADKEGSTGIMVWWLDDWLSRHQDSLDTTTCDELDSPKANVCQYRFHSTDGSTWAPCASSCP
jgi:hypothetical protein